MYCAAVISPNVTAYLHNSFERSDQSAKQIHQMPRKESGTPDFCFFFCLIKDESSSVVFNWIYSQLYLKCIFQIVNMFEGPWHFLSITYPWGGYHIIVSEWLKRIWSAEKLIVVSDLVEVLASISSKHFSSALFPLYALWIPLHIITLRALYCWSLNASCSILA